MITLLLNWSFLALTPIVLLTALMIRRRTRKLGVAFLVMYAATYLVLTLNGGYVARDLSGGIGVAGPQPREIAYYWWCPVGFGKSFGTDEDTGLPIMEGTGYCAFFLPLWRIDRAIFHRDITNKESLVMAGK